MDIQYDGSDTLTILTLLYVCISLNSAILPLKILFFQYIKKNISFINMHFLYGKKSAHFAEAIRAGL